jgi:hypothetical protein
MSAHRSAALPFDNDVVILDHVHRAYPPVKRSNTRSVFRFSSLTVVSYTDLNGEVTVVDLVSDPEDEPQDVSTDDPVIPEVFATQESAEMIDDF